MARNPGRTGRPWRRLCAQVYAEESHCWICHHPVDMRLPYPHPDSRSVDHVLPVSQRPDLALERGNVRLCHMRCNLSKGARAVEHPALRTSRRW
jgi:5-methylcytosine-specific restriction endonuclease McrA